MTITVELEGTATSADVELVRDLFGSYGVDAEVTNTYGIGGNAVETAFWIVVIYPAARFFGEISAEVAKRLVDEIWEKRSSAAHDEAAVVAFYEYGEGTSPRFSASPGPGLPEQAYVDLALLANTLRKGKVMYDPALSGWVVDDSQLRGQIKYLYDNFVFSSGRLRRSRWKFWSR